MRSRCLISATCSLLILFASCSISRKISREANDILFKNPSLQNAHTGISIYEPSTGKYWFNHEAHKYFVPASNTKLFSLYAGMKLLGDSIITARISENESTIYVFPNGDPSFLNDEFPNQPLHSILLKTAKDIIIVDTAWKENHFGPGWGWDYYNDAYQAERSLLPVFSNLVRIFVQDGYPNVQPAFFRDKIVYDSSRNFTGNKICVQRKKDGNDFIISGNDTSGRKFSIPFITNNNITSFEVLEKVLGKKVRVAQTFGNGNGFKKYAVKSLLKDSLFRLMLHRSDNFFAEQTLLMASNEFLGYMNEKDIIDTLLKKEFSQLSQKPNWVDGSGLSRYNLFTPNNFVFVLEKLYKEYGLERMRNIFPTGGTGTLEDYYKEDKSFIYAKTGTLSNHSALSGYLMTRKKKLLIFSLIANHYKNGATPVRKSFEQFIKWIRNNN